MNMKTKPLCLPLLYKENTNLLSPSLYEILLKLNILHLWPGFEQKPEGYFQPDDYLLNPKESTACINDFAAMSEAALQGMPVQSLLGVQDNFRKTNDLVEQDLIEQFAQNGQKPQNSSVSTQHTLKTAQKNLIWAWLLEQRFYEINSLTKSYADGAKNLANMLGVEQDAALLGLERIETELDVSNSFLPPWQFVLENAAIFLENNAYIVVNHDDLSAYINDICNNIKPLSEATKQVLNIQDLNASECKMNLGTVLGKSERQINASLELQKNFNFILLENL